MRAEVKARLKLNRLSLRDLFDQSDDDDMLAKLKVVSVLESLPGVGKVRARRLMAELDISESRRLRGLGDKPAPRCSRRSRSSVSPARETGSCSSWPGHRVSARARSASGSSLGTPTLRGRSRPPPGPRGRVRSTASTTTS